LTAGGEWRKKAEQVNMNATGKDMVRILGIKFRDYGQIHYFTLPDGIESDRIKSDGMEPDGMENLASVSPYAPQGRPAPNEIAPNEIAPDEAVADEAGPDASGPAPPPASGIGLGASVIAATEQGPGIGTVVQILECGREKAQTLPAVLRLAAPEDRAVLDENRTFASGAFRFCAEKIRARALDMKLVDVETAFDKSKIVFYFTAPTRIDFRELVKDLVREYHVRIELRQIGVRHETQMVGAVGNCGMVCCCRRFLRKFAPVTIKMAKEQNLFLNPSKISGICERLLCCLSYEQDNYDAFHRECPRLGKKYQTSRGEMRVLRASMFRNSVIAQNGLGQEEELSLDEWRAMKPRRQEPAQPDPRADAGVPPEPDEALIALDESGEAGNLSVEAPRSSGAHVDPARS
jgi:cell fate regulator YaaT (PSP1 superfamily)